MAKIVVFDDSGKPVVEVPVNPLVPDTLNVERVLLESLDKHADSWRVPNGKSPCEVRAAMLARDSGLVHTPFVLDTENGMETYVSYTSNYGYSNGVMGASFVARFDQIPISMVMCTLENLNDLLSKNELTAVEFSMQTEGKSRRSLVFNTYKDRDRKPCLQGFESERSKAIIRNAQGKHNVILTISVGKDYDNSLGVEPPEKDGE